MKVLGFVSRIAAALVVILLVTGGVGRAEYYSATPPGERFLALANARVYAVRSEEGRIVSDVPRWHLIYAKPTDDPRWLAVTAMGDRQYPDSFEHYHIGDVSGLKDGKFDVRAAYSDNDSYSVVSGFAPSASFGSVDTPEKLPASVHKGMSLPDFYGRGGVTEPRFLPTNQNEDPYSSVAQLSTVALIYDGKRLVINLFSCSAFFIENTRLVGSAGHCIAGTTHGP